MDKTIALDQELANIFYLVNDKKCVMCKQMDLAMFQ